MSILQYLAGLAEHSTPNIPLEDISIAKEHLGDYDHERCKTALRSIQEIISLIKSNATPEYDGGTLYGLYNIAKSAKFADESQTVLVYTCGENIRYADVVKKDLERNGFVFSDFVYAEGEKPKKNPNLNKVLQFKLSFSYEDFTDVIFGLKFFADICALHTEEGAEYAFFLSGNVLIALEGEDETEKFRLEREEKLLEEKGFVKTSKGFVKPAKPTFEETAAHFLSGEKLASVLDLFKFLKEHKMSPRSSPRAGDRDNFHGTWTCRHKNKSGSRHITYIWLGNDNFTIGPGVPFRGFEHFYDENMKKFAKSLVTNAITKSKNAGYSCQGGTLVVFGETFPNSCRCYTFNASNPTGTVLENLKKMFLVNKQISEYIGENVENMPPKLTESEKRERFDLAVKNLEPRSDAVDIDLENMSAENANKNAELLFSDGLLSVKNTAEKDWPKVSSVEKFTGFVKIEGCAKVNSKKGIELHYGKARLRLPMDIKDIRLYEPLNGICHYVKLDSSYNAREFYEFEWYIGATFMAVTVNGELVHYGENYAYMEKPTDVETAVESVTLVPGTKSTLIVERLRVTEI